MDEYVDVINIPIDKRFEMEKEIDGMNQLAWDSLHSDLERSRELSIKAGELAEKIGYESGYARSLLGLGGYYSATAQYQDSIEYLNDALKRYKLLEDLEGQMDTYITLGRSYNGLEQFEAAIENNSKGLEIGILLNDRSGKNLAYNGLGFTYDYLGKKNEALEYFLKGLELNEDDPYILNNIGCVYSSIGKYEEAIDYTERIIRIEDVEGSLLAAALGNLGEYYGEMGNIDKAKEYCVRSYETAIKYNFKPEEGYALLVNGKVCRKNKEYDEAVKYLNRALGIFKDLNTRYDQAETLMNIGKVYIDISEKEKAISVLIEALEAAEQISAIFFLTEIHLLLANLYEEIMELNNAIGHYKKHMEYSKEMAEMELENKLHNLTVESRIVQATKDAEIHRLKNVELKEKNEELKQTAEALENTLKNLKETQAQMLQSEKMAALGQLISGIAHEINTPLGAIQASIGNIEIYLKNTITCKIPQLIKCTDESEQNLFFHMLSESVNTKQANSSRDERAYKKALSLELKGLNIDNTRNIADMIISMGLYKSYKNYIPLLMHRESHLIIQTCYELSDILRNGEHINSAIEKVSKIIYALKNYSHFDYSGTAVDADVITGIENVLALFAHSFKQGVEIVKNYGPIPYVICYPDELNQVWTNLISNALYAMDYSGTMEIETFVQGNYACIRVTDSGFGIPDEIKERIFEPFFTTKKQGEGTGIGLEIVRKIVDKHHGIIEVQSIPGRTSFTVKLPIVQG